jgi:uncharacterized membrane protein
VFALACVGLSGLGVYLGRFERWNSWDVVLYPRAVLADAIRPLIDPLSHTRTIAVSVMFAALLFVCYVTFITAMRRERAS